MHAVNELREFKGTRAPAGDIAAMHWQGGPVDCAACEYAALRELPAEQGCEPGHACLQDMYALRIARFFRWHPEQGDRQLGHAYFEVRAIAARHANVFRLASLMDDPDETVRLQIALRLPQQLLGRMARDPHREVRIRVAQRLETTELAAMRNDSDYGVREWVARRLPLALLPPMVRDPDRAVRLILAQRLEMPALLILLHDESPEVRRTVAERLPAPLLPRLIDDEDWRVRWEVAQRADLAQLGPLREDIDPLVRQSVLDRQDQRQDQRQALSLVPGAPHG